MFPIFMKRRSNHYNKKYFLERDHIDPHIAEAICMQLTKSGFKKILDVGCGSGKLVAYLQQRGFTAHGCDVSPAALQLARKHIDARFLKQASALKLPYETGSFDFVSSISVIEHLSYIDGMKFLKEARRILKPGGRIFLVTPNYSTPIRLIQKNKWFGYSDPTHIQFYSPASLGELLKKCGFIGIQNLFATKYDANFYWDLPSCMQKIPLSLKTMITYSLTSTPLFILRNSFWIGART